MARLYDTFRNPSAEFRLMVLALGAQFQSVLPLAAWIRFSQQRSAVFL